MNNIDKTHLNKYNRQQTGDFLPWLHISFQEPINTVHQPELGRRQRQAINKKNIASHYGLIQKILYDSKE
jgi:hypothetical protein